MVKERVTDFDVSEYLQDESTIAAYLSAILEDDDPQLLLAAIGDIAKAKGMSKIASDAGLGRESLYKALNSEAKPRFDTILKVLHALGVNLSISPRHSRRTPHGKSKGRPVLRRTSRSSTSRTEERART